MIPVIQQERRQVVPRWRDSAVAAITGEIAPLRIRTFRDLNLKDDLSALISDWERNRSVAFASDLLAAALVLNTSESDEVTEAASYIISVGERATYSARSLAEYILRDSEERGPSELSSVLSEEDLASDARELIRRKKRILRRQPRNTLGWVDIARCYATLGQDEKALDCMANGLILAPNNRFVLRSATRLHVHMGDYDIAYELLRRNPATRADPWLRAAEIAIVDLMDKVPRRLGHTRRMLRAGDVSPIHVSELASAVATCELRAGSLRSAQRLFNLSLTEPTENAVAQSNWARRYMSGIPSSPDHLFLPRTFEARTLNYLQRFEPEKCLHECIQWLKDEPFSLQPVVVGMFVAMVALEDHQKAIELGRWGLKSHPTNFLIRNNLTIAYAESGQIEEARREHSGISKDGLSLIEKTCWLSTRGMLEFRERSFENGRRLFRQALEEDSKQTFSPTGALALVFWLCEEIRAEEYQQADLIARRLREMIDRFSIDNPEFKIALSKLERLESDYTLAAQLAN